MQYGAGFFKREQLYEETDGGSGGNYQEAGRKIRKIQSVASITESEYEEVAVFCFRFLGFTTLEQVDNMTLREYRLLVRAHELKSVDEDYRCHEQAFLNFAVQARRKNGNPVYKRFRQFYDYERQIEKVANGNRKKPQFSALAEFLKRKEGSSNGGKL